MPRLSQQCPAALPSLQASFVAPGEMCVVPLPSQGSASAGWRCDKTLRCHCWINLGRAIAVRGLLCVPAGEQSSDWGDMAQGRCEGRCSPRMLSWCTCLPPRVTQPGQRIWLRMFINRYKLMRHFRCSCPERYRFACSLKNLKLFSPIYSWSNYWGTVERSRLEFWFLLPPTMVFNQIVNAKCISAMAWGLGAGLPPRCPGATSGPLPTRSLTASAASAGAMPMQKGCAGWPMPLAQPDGPEW